MDNSQIERIGINKVESFFIEEFDWIAREQTILDYGIDMQIEIKNKGQATGILIALQIKSGESHCKKNIDKDIFTYRGELRHLEYWENHSLPVLFIWYNPSNKNLYWQQISSENININEKSWTLRIPSTQILLNNSKEEIISKCFNLNDYEIIEESDISINIAKRYTLKVIITIKEPYIIKKIIKIIYEKYIYEIDIINTITIFYYRNIKESKTGIYFCRTQWNNKKYNYRLNTIKANDNIDEINIEWDRNSNYSNKFISQNSSFILKDKYIKICDDIVKYYEIILDQLNNKNLEESKLFIFKEKDKIKNYFDYMSEESYQLLPELINLKMYRNYIISNSDDIVIILEDKNRSIKNKIYLLNMYLTNIQKNINNYKNYKNTL